jgi:hypothetical protein
MSRLSAEHIEDSNRRIKAETIVGEAKYAEQKSRAIRSRVNAMKTGGSTDKADTIEAIKRVGEYRAADHGKRKK